MYTAHIAHEWIPNQVTLGRAVTLIHAAELVLYRIADGVDHHVQARLPLSDNRCRRLHVDCSLAVSLCLDISAEIYGRILLGLTPNSNTV